MCHIWNPAIETISITVVLVIAIIYCAKHLIDSFIPRALSSSPFISQLRLGEAAVTCWDSNELNCDDDEVQTQPPDPRCHFQPRCDAVLTCSLPQRARPQRRRGNPDVMGGCTPNSLLFSISTWHFVHFPATVWCKRLTHFLIPGWKLDLGCVCWRFLIQRYLSTTKRTFIKKCTFT